MFHNAPIEDIARDTVPPIAICMASPPGSRCHADPTDGYPAWWTYKKQWKMAIEIVDFPIKNGVYSGFSH